MRLLTALTVTAALAFAGVAHAAVPAQKVSYASALGGEVRGELTLGQGKGRHPAVLFVHWLGEPKTTNLTEFEADARALARKGITSLRIDAMWSKRGWFNTVGSSAEADLKQADQQLADLRHGLDLLAGRKDVDASRIAFVGHDFGAMFGALLAGVDQRPRVYVLMAGVPTFSEWYLLGKTHPDREAYVKAIDTLDIQGGLKQSKAKAFLFQFAAHDHYITAERGALFFDAAPLPRGAFVYDTDHALNVPQAAADRRAWLVEQLVGP